jgi:hypothetical protein
MSQQFPDNLIPRWRYCSAVRECMMIANSSALRADFPATYLIQKGVRD